jgi:hypothetical protein
MYLLRYVFLIRILNEFSYSQSKLFWNFKITTRANKGTICACVVAILLVHWMWCIFKGIRGVHSNWTSATYALLLVHADARWRGRVNTQGGIHVIYCCQLKKILINNTHTHNHTHAHTHAYIHSCNARHPWKKETGDILLFYPGHHTRPLYIIS